MNNVVPFPERHVSVYCEAVKRQLNDLCKPTLAARAEQIYDLDFVERESDMSRSLAYLAAAKDIEEAIDGILYNAIFKGWTLAVAMQSLRGLVAELKQRAL